MQSIVNWWRNVPFKVAIAVTLACLCIGEQYPFSNFPMFGSFVGKTYYLYLADQDDKPIPMLSLGVSANALKKFYDGRLRKLRNSSAKKIKLAQMDDRTVAEETLQYVVSKNRGKHGHLTQLKLVRVDVSVTNGEVHKDSRTAAEAPL
ncbi:MAG TPA: hypothetical protein VF585_05835 [Chthoniobacterales bacterium]|jgi:hypothetical protein